MIWGYYFRMKIYIMKKFCYFFLNKYCDFTEKYVVLRSSKIIALTNITSLTFFTLFYILVYINLIESKWKITSFIKEMSNEDDFSVSG